jgi:sulfate adenylyltransferase large subunit
MEMLRFITAGSVDDGKSTLIGRLLYDSKSLLQDQVAALEKSRHRAADGQINLALLTDGLRAEREQGITIDVAYKYFATPKRKFIIADTPGHVQYTRNMVTGASTADLAILLVDATQGILEQTRRHAYLAKLLRIPHIVLAVNKMDALGFDQPTFDRICAEFAELTKDAGFASVTAIPLSALAGDNVVDRSTRTPWYTGPALLQFLEEIDVDYGTDQANARLAVQQVIFRDDAATQDYRGYAGQVGSGTFRPGDEVVILPLGVKTKLAGVDRGGEPVAEVFAPMSVTLRLAEDVDVGRGDIIAGAANPPATAKEIRSRLCWMDERPLTVGARLLVRHTTGAIKGIVTAIESVVNIHTFKDEPGFAKLALNDIGVVTVKLARPLVFDAYATNRTMGSFVLVDEASNGTVAAGMIIEGVGM